VILKSKFGLIQRPPPHPPTNTTQAVTHSIPSKSPQPLPCLWVQLPCPHQSVTCWTSASLAEWFVFISRRVFRHLIPSSVGAREYSTTDPRAPRKPLPNGRLGLAGLLLCSPAGFRFSKARWKEKDSRRRLWEVERGASRELEERHWHLAPRVSLF
jgi:hypothetical protein